MTNSAPEDVDHLDREACRLIVEGEQRLPLAYIAYFLRYGTDYLLSIPVHSDHYPSVFRAVLSQRLFSAARATVELIRNGFAAEAKTLIRSMLECFLRLAAICVDEKRTFDFLNQEHLGRRGILTDLKNFYGLHPEVQTEIMSIEVIDQKLAEIEVDIAEIEAESGSKLGHIGAHTWAKWGKQESLFYAAYSMRSLSVHHAPRDMIRNVVSDKQGNIVELNYGPDHREAKEALTDVILLLQQSVILLRDATGIEYPDELTTLVTGGSVKHGIEEGDVH